MSPVRKLAGLILCYFWRRAYSLLFLAMTTNCLIIRSSSSPKLAFTNSQRARLDVTIKATGFDVAAPDSVTMLIGILQNQSKEAEIPGGDQSFAQTADHDGSDLAGSPQRYPNQAGFSSCGDVRILKDIHNEIGT